MSDRTDLMLVNPGAREVSYGVLGVTLAGIEPPLWCAMIASFVRGSGGSVKITDADALSLSPWETAAMVLQANPALVNVVVMGTNPSASSTPKMSATRQFLKCLKEEAPDVPVMLSGLHPSALPERTLKEEKTDFVACGEGFHTSLELLETLKNGKKDFKSVRGLCYRREGGTVFNSPAPLISAPDSLPFAAWDLLPMDSYRAHNWHCFGDMENRSPYAAIYTSFGCPYSCVYCNVRAIYNGNPGIRYRSPEKVVDEMGLLAERYGVRHLKIADELFVINRKRVETICEMIVKKGYDLNIWAYARVDTVDADILGHMKSAGVNWLCYGIESASEKVREGVSKRIRQERIGDVVQMTKDAGINVLGNFIFGLPDDDMETMEETLQLAERLNCEYVNFYAAMAYPGSPLYYESVEKGTRLPETWDGYAQLSLDALPLPTKHLTGEEVLRFRDGAFTRYFSRPEYLGMIEEKFGEKEVMHIRDMLTKKIKRKHV